MSKLLTALTALFTLFWAAGYACANPDANNSAGINADTNAAAELRATLSATTSLAGTFIQTLYDSDGKQLQQSEGDFILQRPGRFYWDTQKPFPQLLVSNQQKVWLYDPDLQQVTVRPVDKKLRRTPAMLLSQSAKTLAQNFTIKREESSNYSVYTLTPKAADGLFKSLELYFDNKTLVRIDVFDSLEQRTEFALKVNKRNRPVDESKFTFTAPKGVDVLID